MNKYLVTANNSKGELIGAHIIEGISLCFSLRGYSSKKRVIEVENRITRTIEHRIPIYHGGPNVDFDVQLIKK